MKFNFLLISIIILLILSFNTFAQCDARVPAFPGAEGFGAYATGGRGGKVITVSNLNSEGPGSFQDALNQNEPRIIVFNVSGVIVKDVMNIPYGNLTIAGQTSPGGITINGRLYTQWEAIVNNIIIRNLRIRPEYTGQVAGNQFDGIQFAANKQVIFDHISVSGAVDEVVDIFHANDITFQYSTVEFSGSQGHYEGAHNYGLISKDARVSVHHNLFAHHKNRNPCLSVGPAESINNVAYNVRHGFVHHNPAIGEFNLIGNYFIDGSNDRLIPFYFDDENQASKPSYYLNDNYYVGHDNCNGVINNPWTECDDNLVLDETHRSETIFDFSAEGEYYEPVTLHSSSEAYDIVMQKAGAFPRDILTRTAIQDMQDKTGEWGAFIPDDYMEGIQIIPPPLDSDGDGMSDDWENQKGLDPNNYSDNTLDTNCDGYTNIEEYINSFFSDELTCSNQGGVCCDNSCDGIQKYANDCTCCIGDCNTCDIDHDDINAKIETWKLGDINSIELIEYIQEWKDC
jgi:pectate lyase